MRSPSTFRSLARDRRGAAIVEFAFVLPAMLLLLMGTAEIGHAIFARVTLDSALVEAARAATAQTKLNQASRDTVLRTSITSAMADFPKASGKALTITTKVYADFSSASPETYNDTNRNGRYDLGETYVDRNKNNRWDAAAPKPDVMGGPGDVVAITASYPKAYLFNFLSNQWVRDFNLTSTTVVRNEAVARSGS